VLTPYLGQVRAIRRALAQSDIGVMISELDQADLVKEGLDDDVDEFDVVSGSSGTERGDRGASAYSTAYSAAKRGGKPKQQFKAALRVSTVDNYQGEGA
jgi:hypothetical protein